MANFCPFTEAEITFEGTRFDGAVVRVRLDVPLGDVLKMPNTRRLTEVWPWVQEHVLLEWNLTGLDDKPIPTSVEVTMLPQAFVSSLVNAWMTLAVEVPDPLGKTSSVGST